MKDTSIWGTKTPADCSWAWRKILKLRSLAQPYVKHLIGDGIDSFFWYDMWHPIGPLYQFFTKKLLSNLGLLAQDKVSKWIENGNWKWPCGRKLTREVKLLQQNTPIVFVPFINEKDQIVRTLSSSGKFAVSTALTALRSKQEIVPWWKLVWYKDYISRFSFILWLLCRKRCLQKTG